MPESKLPYEAGQDLKELSDSKLFVLFEEARKDRNLNHPAVEEMKRRVDERLIKGQTLDTIAPSFGITRHDLNYRMNDVGCEQRRCLVSKSTGKPLLLGRLDALKEVA